IQEFVLAADEDMRFFNDSEMSRIETALASTGSADGAKIRRVAARIMRDFQGTILEGAQERLAELQPELVKEGGMLYPPNRAQAFWEELKHLLRLAHYATAIGTREYTRSRDVTAFREMLSQIDIPRALVVESLQAMQLRAGYLCSRCAKESPESWVASFSSLQHLIDGMNHTVS
ncbi:hypothetical protein GUITHDRAFT_66095, partial [Guillardia theta CCMP2712]